MYDVFGRLMYYALLSLTPHVQATLKSGRILQGSIREQIATSSTTPELEIALADLTTAIASMEEFLLDLGVDPAKPDQTFTVAGFKPPRQRPKIGDTIAAEFQRSWVVWEIVKLRFPGDPPDMFFAEVKVKTQVWKEGSKPV